MEENNNIPEINSTVPYSFIGGGRSCSATGSYANFTPGIGNSSYGYSALAIGQDSLDNFFINHSLKEDKYTFIVKYYPEKVKWKIYNQGQLTVADNINLIGCSSKSSLFVHENKTIGCFIVKGTELTKDDDGTWNLK